MRIAYFVWEFPPKLVGGLGTYASEITPRFVKMGHDVCVFTMNHEGKLKTHEVMGGMDIHRPLAADATDILHIFVDDELRRWGAGMKFFSDILTYNMLSANKFVNLLSKEGNFDIIVCHDWLSSIAGVISMANTSLPLVFHVHSTEHGRSGGKGSKTVRDLEYYTALKANLIITVSYAMREELHMLNFPYDKIRVCWNGVDCEKYHPKNISETDAKEYRRKLGIGDDERLILFTGRLTWVKGVDALIRALPTVLQKFPKTKLAILGVGEMKDELLSLASRLGISGQIVMIDRWAEERERIMLYSCADVVCIPSRYEPFGIVALEAMSMKKPVIVGMGGLREIVQNGENGLYCDPNSPDTISDAINRIFEDGAFASRISEGARNRVEKFYSWDKIAKETIELYKSAIQK
ncbi:MAG: glycosyltransferase family 4 protein [Candidatus Micrarchaeia archaeon]